MRLVRFCLVGVVVFLFEAVILYGLIKLIGLDATIARLLSFPSAVVLAWHLNRGFTFRSLNAPSIGELGRYTLNNLGGLLINVGVYYVLLWGWPALEVFPISALGAGSLAGLAFNYLGSLRWVFRGPSQVRPPD